MPKCFTRWPIALLICLLGSSLVPAAAANPSPSVGRWVQTTVTDFLAGSLDGAVVTSAGDGAVSLVEGRAEGYYLSSEQPTSFPFRGAGVLYRARVPAGASVAFALRARADSGSWSDWIELGSSAWEDPEGRVAGQALAVFPEENTVLQYRVTFRRGAEGVPVLEEAVLVYLPAAEAPVLRVRPPWEETDGRPHPAPAASWRAQAGAAQAATPATSVLRVEVLPAALAEGMLETPAVLRMIERFQQEALGLPDLTYGYFVDGQGIVYEGRGSPLGETLYIGVVGGSQEEAVSPTAEDALVALLDGWRDSLHDPSGQWRLSTPGDPALGERLQARLEAGALRQNRWWFVRGATAPSEHEWLLLANVGARRTVVIWNLFTESGQRLRGVVSIPGRSRASLFLNPIVPKGDFWTVVSPASEVVVERALYYGPDADASAGLDFLSRDWYFPGGSQEQGFTTTLWLLNPLADPAAVTVTVFSPQGPAQEEVLALAGGMRLALPLHQVYRDHTVLGCRVQASRPIAAEQAVRFGTGGYGMPGTPILSRSWTVPGVETEAPFWTVLALLNPSETPVGITMTLMTSDGTSLRRSYTLRPGEQRLNLNTILPQLSLAAQIDASQPIAVARLTFFDDLRAAHAVLGSPRLARHWYLAEGATADPFEAVLAVANPNRKPAEVSVTVLGTHGAQRTELFLMPARSRLTVLLNELAPSTAALGVVVETDQPVVVERSMYLHDRQGGHAGLGIPR
ncbi:MAG: DUF5719 family protein [Chloroflexia bacterium]